jgi:alpha-tubulin suppressor-like RCC1 family protein
MDSRFAAAIALLAALASPAVAPLRAHAETATAVSAGFSHSCAITSAGALLCWGYNGSGQLGDDTTIDHSTPQNVLGLSSGIAAVTGGGSHTCAIDGAGGALCWGENGSGQLGDGSTTDRDTAVDVVGLGSGVTAIAAGTSHTCAITSGGGVKCWGSNASGQLGDGTTTNRTTPVQVSGLTSVNTVAAGLYHTVANKSDGTAWSWGYNVYGQLGDGTTTNRSAPVQVSSLTGITAIAAGGFHSVARKNDGSVWTWGSNSDGQLGDGTQTPRTSPVASTFTNATAVSAGHSFTIAR